MNTLGARLTLSVVWVVALALIAFSALLFWGTRETLVGQFDERLLEEGRALANMVEERGPGVAWELELSAFAQFDQSAGAELYQLWLDDGSVLARSASLGGSQLTREATGPLTLPSGAPGRQVVGQHRPRLDEESPAIPSGRRLTIAVARDTLALDLQLRNLIWLLVVGGGVVLVAAAAASRFAVHRGLRPVGQLAERIDAIDAKHLTSRLPLEGLPLELLPVVGGFNGLLTRLSESFSRERRFSADVSHELRTPIAGLRSILEVTASRERAPAEYQAALSDALAVTRQMTGLVETLLTLARLETVPIEGLPPAALRPQVEAALVPLAALAKSRGLTVTNGVGADVLLAADEARLHLLLNNLLSNACDYTAAGGQIAVVCDPAHGILLEVQNSGPAIPDAALPKLFDRFFRADPSRANTAEHHGLGLSVVRAVCDQLGASVTAHNRADGWVIFTVRK